ncbi:Pathogenesis-related protein 1B precursor (PR-1B) [Flavobacteriaceae bacterium 3519-10]|nr:Pathogenesis-related protein 1B precursor (PR-1B) [Flavobacteriaceae bacterium 3519-10]
MKTLILTLLICLFSGTQAQTKFWLSGNYSNGSMKYLNNGKAENIAVSWDKGAARSNSYVVLHGDFRRDAQGKETFFVDSESPKVNLYSGIVNRQKFNCPLNALEGKLTISSDGKSIDFASAVSLKDKANITVTKAELGTKFCDGKRYRVYYIKEIKEFVMPLGSNSTPTNSTNSSAATGSSLTSAEAEAALAFHNKARADVGVNPLNWSSKLSEYAQNWANHLVVQGKCNLEHRPDSGEWKSMYGENIAMLVPARNAASEASKLWYDEIKDYKHEVLNNSNWAVAGHYTQMVWHSTQSVGIGAAKCANGYTIVVANYDPSGNMIGQKAY